MAFFILSLSFLRQASREGGPSLFRGAGGQGGQGRAAGPHPRALECPFSGGGPKKPSPIQIPEFGNQPDLRDQYWSRGEPVPVPCAIEVEGLKRRPPL